MMSSKAFIVSVVATIALMLGVGTVQASLIAYEPFNIGIGVGDYTVGSLSGQNPTVTGFSGAWTNTQAGSATISSTGLTYPGLATSGGMDAGVPNSRSVRALATPFTDSTSGTYWMSFLFQNTVNGGQYQAWETYNATGTLGQDSSRAYHIANGAAGYPNGGNFDVNENASLSLGAADTNVHLFVIKMDFVAGGNDTFTAWMDPSLASEPTGGLAVIGNWSWTYLGIWNASNPGTANFDELRIGTTFADVVPAAIPEPSTWLLVGLGLVSLFFRRSRK